MQAFRDQFGTPAVVVQTLVGDGEPEAALVGDRGVGGLEAGRLQDALPEDLCYGFPVSSSTTKPRAR